MADVLPGIVARGVYIVFRLRATGGSVAGPSSPGPSSAAGGAQIRSKSSAPIVIFNASPCCVGAGIVPRIRRFIRNGCGLHRYSRIAGTPFAKLRYATERRSHHTVNISQHSGIRRCALPSVPASFIWLLLQLAMTINLMEMAKS